MVCSHPLPALPRQGNHVKALDVVVVLRLTRVGGAPQRAEMAGVQVTALRRLSNGSPTAL